MEKGDPLFYMEKLNIRTDTVIVNQCGRAGEREETFEGHRVRLIERDETADDDICIFCDNDVRYADDAVQTIEQAFSRHPGAGIICFFIERPERHSPVKAREGRMSKKDMMRIFSPEMAVRRSRLKELRFDEDFGAGAKYKMGEENIFLFEAARRGIERIYVPVQIAETLPNESSWFTAYDEAFYHARGAGYEAMDGKLWHILTWQNLLRKRHEYGDTITTLGAYKAMKEGRREYRAYKR